MTWSPWSVSSVICVLKRYSVLSQVCSYKMRRQLSTQDFQLSSGNDSVAGSGQGERCDRRAVVIDEPHADLVGVGCADVVLDAHAASDLAGGAANVEVVALLASLRGPAMLAPEIST